MIQTTSLLGGSKSLDGLSEACSIIIPIDLSRRPLSILKRLRSFLDASWPLGCTEVIQAHLTYGSRWDYALEKMVNSRRDRGYNVVMAQTRRLSHESGIPLGRLRNIGAQAASGRELLFADVDLILPTRIIFKEHLNNPRRSG